MAQERLDAMILTAVLYSRCLPSKFVSKYLLIKLTADGKEVFEEYRTTPQMTSQEVWDLLCKQDQEEVKGFQRAFGKYKWKWTLVRDETGIDEKSLSRKDADNG